MPTTPRTEFRWTSLEEACDAGLPAIVKRHWDEVGIHKADVPLDVDWARYARLEDDGTLKLMGAWRGETMLGYASFIVMPNLHYQSTLHAINDAIYVDTAYRGVGVRLIRANEKALAELGGGRPVRIVYHVKEHIEQDRGTLGPVFIRMGYGKFESCFDKVVRS